MSTALVWFRRDLRITDNPALSAACERHDRVLPVFIWAPDEEAPWAPGAAARWWLHHSLGALEGALGERGLPLHLATGDSLDILHRLIGTCGAESVYWNRLYEPAVIARDRRIKQALRERDVEVASFNAALLAEPWTLATGAGDPYRVFTPFWRRLEAALPSIPAPLATPSATPPPDTIPDGVTLDRLGLRPTIPWDAGLAHTWSPGEAGALTRLERFLEEAVGGYREQRDRPGVEATSRISPHLHWGEISPRQIVAAVQRRQPDFGSAERADAAFYLREVGWREFAHHLLYHFPDTPARPLHDKFDAFPWRRATDYADDLHAWQRGRTGIPLVDAGMRELWHTGWMHNRVRMVVASLLTKNLLIPWQEGARWFWDTLVDADLANNTLGWQWTAGCGADAAPYFRIFNPLSQAEKFDPDGLYLKRWVPESGAGGNTPQAIVDLAGSRQRALDAYARIKSQPPG